MIGLPKRRHSMILYAFNLPDFCNDGYVRRNVEVRVPAAAANVGRTRSRFHGVAVLAFVHLYRYVLSHCSHFDVILISFS